MESEKVLELKKRVNECGQLTDEELDVLFTEVSNLHKETRELTFNYDQMENIVRHEIKMRESGFETNKMLEFFKHNTYFKYIEKEEWLDITPYPIYIKKVEMNDKFDGENIYFDHAIIINPKYGTLKADDTFYFTLRDFKEGNVTKIFKEDWNHQVSEILEKIK